LIPGKIVQFFNEHANMGFGGIRDAELRPAGCRVSGWRVEPDGRTLTALIPGPFVERILGPLADNGEFAMTAEEHPTHVTYQVKGRFLRQRPVEARDLELVRQTRARLSRTMRPLLPPGADVEPVLRWHAPDPEIVIEVELREVFLQTPGPQAGSRIYPPPAP
jgi:hypothetical protein